MANNIRIPAPEFDFRHRMLVQLRINDLDFMGHVNNNVYLSLFDTAKARYFEDLLNGPVTQENMCLVIVNVNIDFYATTFLDEHLEVLTAIAGVGDRSVKIEQRLLNTDSGEVKSICRTVMAGFDPKNNCGAPLDNLWVELAEKYEGRKLRQPK